MVSLFIHHTCSIESNQHLHKKSDFHQCYLNVLGIQFIGMETGIMVVEASPTLVGSVALDTLELRRLASTANKVVVHPSNATTLKATALLVCVQDQGQGEERERRR